METKKIAQREVREVQGIFFFTHNLKKKKKNANITAT
jgi:hypothetical protein